MSTSPQGDELPGYVLDYLKEQNTLTLATASASGVPRAATYLYVNEGSQLFFWGRPSTISARHIEENSIVSFAIDEYAADLSKTRGIQGTGECSVLLDGERIARVADLFGQKFPNLSPGSTMSISFFRLAPTEIQWIDNSGASSSQREGTFGADFHRERAYSVFSGLPTLPSEGISVTLQTVNVPADAVIARQGGPADKFFIVLEGSVEVVREEAGSHQTLASLGPGDLFGEMAILRDKPRGSTVRAVESTRLLSLDANTFRDLVAQSLGTTPEFDDIIRGRLNSPEQSS
jgi:uncharacterized protein YhbP (UPF0306 family)